MFGIEIVYALVAIVAVFAFVGVVRSAARKSISGTGVTQRRLEKPAAPSKRRRRSTSSEDEAKDDGKPAIVIKAKGRRGAAASDVEEPVADVVEASPDDEEHAAGDEAADETSGEDAPATDVDGTEDDDAHERLKTGLAKTRGGFVARIGKLFARKKIDHDLLGELEEVLFTADIGPKTAEKLFSTVKSNLAKSALEDADAVWNELRSASRSILDVEASALDFSRERPFVLVVIGVNGVGKTTTIGKIAAKLRREGKSVLLAAGDTFRAAAVEQLEVWGERTSCPVVKGKSGADPSSVIFDAIKQAQADDVDVVIADTAGRLHTKVDLMDELAKVGRVIDKAQAGAPHEVFLVLDSTTGQNAIQQAEIFKNAMPITGIVLTKLDGTAKGGVILGIADEMEVPVRYIGIGEQVDDLREFDADDFIDALYAQETQDAA